MKVILVKPNPKEAAEIAEYLQEQRIEVIVVREISKLYQVLENKDYSVVVYYVQGVEDFMQVKYINDSYPDVKLVVSTDAGICSAIDNIRSGHFYTLRQPYHLQQLNEYLGTNITTNENYINKKE